MLCIAGGLLWLSAMAATAAQTDLQPLIEQVLDEPIELSVENAPLADFFAQMSDKTGVSILMPDEAYGLLPYGRSTQVTATLGNVTLREGLKQVLGRLGMAYVVTPTGLEVVPTPGLQRLGRRASWPELETLQWLNATEFVDQEEPLAALRKRLQFHVTEAEPWDLLVSEIRKVGAGSGADVLEAACEALGWSWYVWDGGIVVVSLKEQMKRQLDTMISIRMTNRPLTEVLRNVGRQAGILIRLGPGVSDALPVQTRKNFSLLADNVSAVEALEEIAGLTGLTYRVDAEGVMFELPSGFMGEGRPARSTDPFVGKICVPDPTGKVQIELVVRESDLSPEVNELRKQVLKDADEIIRKALTEHLAKQQPNP